MFYFTGQQSTTLEMHGLLILDEEEEVKLEVTYCYKVNLTLLSSPSACITFIDACMQNHATQGTFKCVTKI